MTNQKRTISGPGAADFLAAGGGEDMPGTSGTKGMGQTRDESEITNPRNLIPRLGPDTEAEPGERPSAGDADRRASASDAEKPAARPEDQVTGSNTGTIGGGGPNAHNPSPIRATGVDDPTAGQNQ